MKKMQIMCFFGNFALVFGTNQSDTMSLYPSIGQISVDRAEVDNVCLHNVDGLAIAFLICVLVEVNAHNEKRCVALFVSSGDALPPFTSTSTEPQ